MRCLRITVRLILWQTSTTFIFATKYQATVDTFAKNTTTSSSWNFDNRLEMPAYSIVGPNALARSTLIERQERLQQRCDAISHEEVLEPQMFHHVLVDDEHKLLYCYVPKVACTNWKRVLMIATGKWSGRDPLDIPAHQAHSAGIFRRLNNYAMPQIEEKLLTYNKFIVVRHPLERLLSAYRNKFEPRNNTSSYFRERFAKRILKKFRANATEESLMKGDDVKFGEFVDFVTHKVENGSQNEHWRPITELCHPCAVNYNMISKYESLAEDATEILERMGVGWIRFPTAPSSSEPTSKRMAKYYSTLSFKQLQDLAGLYSLDFKIFDYTLEEVLGFTLA